MKKILFVFGLIISFSPKYTFGQITTTPTRVDPTIPLRACFELKGEKHYYIRLQNGKVLEAVQNRALQNGCPVQVAAFTGALNQRWIIEGVTGGGCNRIVKNAVNGKALTVELSTGGTAGPITLYDYASKNNQHWDVNYNNVRKLGDPILYSITTKINNNRSLSVENSRLSSSRTDAILLPTDYLKEHQSWVLQEIPFPHSGAYADINGDGRSDFMHVVNNDYVHSWISKGDGTFDIKNRFPSVDLYSLKADANYMFVPGDYDGDGKTDFAHVFNNDYLHIWLSKGDGSFLIKNRFPSTPGYWIKNGSGYRLIPGDFNGDGRTDLFHPVNNGLVHVWLSKGDGTFDIKSRFPSTDGYGIKGEANYMFIPGDYNDDGKTDFVHVVNNDYVHVWLSKGDGTFDIKNKFPAEPGYWIKSESGYRLIPGDFNGDGRTDLFHPVNNGYAHIWLSKGDGTFNIKDRFPATDGYGVKGEANYMFIPGDYNNDGRTDFVHVIRGVKDKKFILFGQIF